MKTELCIDSFKEIPMREQQELNGGILPFLAAAALIIFEEVVSDWDNFKNGLMGLPEEN